MVFAPVDPMTKDKVIAAYLAGHGRNQITRELHEQGIKISHGSVSNFINAYKRQHEQPPHEQEASSGNNNAGVTTGISMARSGNGKASVTPRNGGPLSWFTTEIKSDYQPAQAVAAEPVIEPRAKSAIEDRLEYERDHQWQNYGPAWYSLMNQMMNEKYQRRHEMLVIDSSRKRLEQMQSDLTTRESRILESEPYLSLAKKLQEMGLALEDALPWIETVKEVAQIEKLDTKSASLYVSQELALNRQFRGIRSQIEKANYDLLIARANYALINATTMQKQQALTVVEDLIKRGATESQILQLINFVGEWNRYWHQTSTNNGNLPEQPNIGLGNGNLQQSGNLRQLSNLGPGSNNGDNFSTNDLIRLHMLKSTTERAMNILKQDGSAEPDRVH
jgi:hypothetical protein